MSGPDQSQDEIPEDSPSAKITRAFAMLRSALTADPPPDRLPTVFADSESRVCVINPPAGARSYFLSLWEDGDWWAHGETSDLAIAERITRRWLEDGAQPTELAREFDVVDADDPYQLEDNFVEGRWQSLLAARFDHARANALFHLDELPELIRLAAERPDLRRLVPYTSARSFGVSRRKVPPDNLPLITPVGNGRYFLAARWSGGALEEGSTGVLDRLAHSLARKATAEGDATDVLDILARSSGAEALAEGDAAHVLNALVIHIQQNPRRPNRSMHP